MNPSPHLEASEPGRACITGQFCKTLFLGHSRASHTPTAPPRPVCPPWRLPWSPHKPPGRCGHRSTSAGRGRRMQVPGRPRQLLMAWGVGCACRAVVWEAMKNRQWFRGTRKWGWWHHQSEDRTGVQSREKSRVQPGQKQSQVKHQESSAC